MAQQVERTHGRIAARFLTRSLGLAALTLVVGCADRSASRLDAVVASPPRGAKCAGVCNDRFQRGRWRAAVIGCGVQ